jgi:RNA 2',3'-cyclic 3'-phosphodiesterase
VKRLFIAVDLDEDARSGVADIVTRLAERLRDDRAVGRISWVRPAHLHLTLRFLGDVDEAGLPAIQQAIALPLATAGFDMSLEGLGMFPPAGRPRVVWLGVQDGRAELEALFREVEGRLQSAAFPREARPFQAHLTVGRFRNAAKRPDIEAAGVGKVSIGPCRVDHVTLYESRLSSAGPTYSVVARAMTKALG